MAGSRAVWAGNSEIVTAARLGVHDTETRFVLELTGKAPYAVTHQTGPNRIVIDLPKVSWQPHKTSGRTANGLVSQYYFSPVDATKAQLVLELRNPARVKNAMYIAPESGHDWRLVLDLAPVKKQEFERLAQAAPPPEPAKQPPKLAAKAPAPVAEPEPKLESKPEAKAAPPAPVVTAPAPKVEEPPHVAVPVVTGAAKPAAPPPAGKTTPPGTGKPEAKIAAAEPPPGVASGPKPEAKTETKPETLAKAPIEGVRPPPPRPEAAPPALPHPGEPPVRPVIVIDPGHGGADPGAQAADGTKEKDIVLNVALALAKKLEKSGRYSVVLTRSSDSTLKLHERVDLSRASHGDLFVSLHANLFEKSQAVSGLSIYTLSDRASSKAAADLARTENRADILAGIDLSHENEDVTHILLDLAQHETLGRSVQFAHRLVEAVARTTPLEKNAGQQASLVVLKAPDVPSILVELGYLTNEADLVRMKSDVWIDQFADAFVAAADRHFQIKNARRDERAVLR